MSLYLKKPELQDFIDEQVKAGHFPTAEAAIEAAVAQMKVDHDCVLTESDVRAIEESEAEIDRGDFVDFDAFAAKMRRRFCDH